MGNLVKMSYSEVTATLEALDREGVLSKHLALVRKDESLRRQVAELLKSGGAVPKRKGSVKSVPLKNDKTKDGWTLVEDVPFDGKEFTPDIVEFLKPNESSVNGEVMKQRAKELGAHLGQAHAEYLLKHQELIPTEWRGKYCLTFPGTVWRGGLGSRDVPYLHWSGDRWYLYFYWLENDWHGFDRLVSFRK